LAPSARSVVLVTGIAGATDEAALRLRFKDLMPSVEFEFAPQGAHLQKLTWLQQRLLGLSPDTVWLFNHHQDSVIVAAVQPESGYQVRFYHHGDHHLCLGVHLAYAEHIDPHPMGFHFCRDVLCISNNRYLPLVARDQGIRAAHPARTDAALVTCTAASSNKLEVPYFIRYVDVVPQLLQASKGKHIHIGCLSPFALWEIRRGMRRLGLPDSAFEHIPYVPSVWRTLQEKKVDVYLASFPYGGAKTLIEAMGCGVAVVLQMHPFSRLLCTYDMAPAEAFKWRHTSELCTYLKQIGCEELTRQGQLSRRCYQEFYCEDLLRKGLADWGQALPAPALSKGFSADALQEALDIFASLSWSGITWRFIKKASRKIKSLKS